MYLLWLDTPTWTDAGLSSARGHREPRFPPVGRIGKISRIRRYAAGALVAGCALIAAACSSTHKPAHVAAGPTITTTIPATTTTGSTPPTAPPGAPPCPLTGLPAVTPANVTRPALSVKVDNAPAALPQLGLNNADIVTEEVVEGGLTRFFVTFQCEDAAVVGPIRSARPVDADLLRQLNGGILVYSGAAYGEIAPSKAHSNAVLISMDAGNRGFYRDLKRRAPSNVFGSTASFYQEAYRVAGPHIAGAPQLLQYSTTAPSGLPINQVSMVFSSFDAVSWIYNPANGVYHRVQNAVVDRLSDGSSITASNIVILSITLAHTGIIDQSGNEDPLDVIIGSGTAWVLRNGTLVEGTWKRPSYAVPMQLLDSTGNVIPLQPGRTWVELLPRTSPGQPHFN